MMQYEDLVGVILTTKSGMRLHLGITKKAEQRAIELINQEGDKTITHERRTELFFQAMGEFPSL